MNAKIAKIFENGVSVSFLRGMQGTIFVDHLPKEAPTKYKVGERVQARVISHDFVSKASALSLLPHICELDSKKASPTCEVGAQFDKAKVTQIVYGGSYKLSLPGCEQQAAFLHKSHLPGADVNPEDSASDDGETKKKQKAKKVIDELKLGQTVDKVRVKAVNYFDGVVQLTMRNQILNSAALDYSQLTVGQFVNATIDSVNDPKKQVVLKINDFVKGLLKLDHFADFPVKQIPPKFTAVGKQIKVRVFSVEDRKVLFTKKDTLMKHDVPIPAS